MLEMNESKRPSIEDILRRIQDNDDASRQDKKSVIPNRGEEEEVKQEIKELALDTRSNNEKDDKIIQDVAVSSIQTDEIEHFDPKLKKYLEDLNPSNIKEINLERVKIGDEGAAALSKNTVVDQPHSTKFIQGNSIGKEGAAALEQEHLVDQPHSTKFIQ